MIFLINFADKNTVLRNHIVAVIGKNVKGNNDEIFSDFGSLWMRTPFWGRQSSAQLLRGAVLQRLRQVGDADGFALRQVGNGAGHTEHAVIAAGRQSKLFIGLTHQGCAAFVQRAVSPKLLGAHLGVTGGAAGAEALVLNRPGSVHSGLDFSRGFTRGAAAQLVKVQSGNVNFQINAVKQRAGQAAQILLDALGRAAAPSGRVAVPAAFAGIHGADHLKPAGIGHRAGHPGDLHLPVLQRLPEDLQRSGLKFGQLVQKQNARQTWR